MSKGTIEASGGAWLVKDASGRVVATAPTRREAEVLLRTLT